MTPRTTEELLATGRALLAAVAAQIQGAEIDDGEWLMLDGWCAACVLGSGNVAATLVYGWDGREVVTAMPSAIRTPNGKASQVQEVVSLIAERMAERIRRAPEMEALAAKAGPSRAPGESHYSDGKEVRHG